MTPRVIVFEADDFIELACTQHRPAVIDDGGCHREQRADRVHRGWETLPITHHRLNVSVAYRLNIDGRLRRSAQSPIAENMTFIIKKAVERLSFTDISLWCNVFISFVLRRSNALLELLPNPK